MHFVLLNIIHFMVWQTTYYFRQQYVHIFSERVVLLEYLTEVIIIMIAGWTDQMRWDEVPQREN